MKDTNKEIIIYGLGISLLLIIIIFGLVLCNKTASFSYKNVEPIIIDTKEELVEEEIEIKNEDNPDCSCIKTARAEGVDIPYNTNAEDFIANSVPQIGGLVLMEYGLISHVAVIVRFINEGIIIREGNKEYCKKTERLIPYSYHAIKGFWNPEK